MDVFLKAKKLLGERRVQVAEEWARLRRTLMKERRLSPALINDTVGLPSTASIANISVISKCVSSWLHFQNDCEYLDSQMWDEQIAKLSSRLLPGSKKQEDASFAAM
jgi:hypothetical protein